MLKLDHMGMRVEQALMDALRAVREGDLTGGLSLQERDAFIDRTEVEIEAECIRLLALYQPAAIDLRTLCTIIKVNSDLERIADLASNIGRQVRYVIEESVPVRDFPEYDALASLVGDELSMTTRMLNVADTGEAERVIHLDREVDEVHRKLIESVLEAGERGVSPEATLTLINLGRALERIGDHCTNIAEDVIFLRTGDIVRHPGAFGEPAA
jgi:phosphate transport system protein